MTFMKSICTIPIIALGGCVAYYTYNKKKTHDETISTQNVLDAQEQWGKGIVEIGKVYTEGGDFVSVARRLCRHSLWTVSRCIVQAYKSICCTFSSHQRRRFIVHDW